ncbi:MAG: zinc ribbon domain-containing protein [Dehalococcoidia bacterium]|nr:zinc ribbon domain-containing protein [Dehalococcoidia bacterium]
MNKRTTVCGQCGRTNVGPQERCLVCHAELPAVSTARREEPLVREGVLCAQCGATSNGGSKFCRECGAPLHRAQASPAASRRFCSQCGTLVPPGARFCSACGHPFSR